MKEKTEPTTTTPAAAATTSALNVYKKVAIIRRSSDVLSYEDPEGDVKTISDLHVAAAETTPLNKARSKLDIPVPKIRTVETYETDIPAIYDCPLAYVRHNKPSHQDLRDQLEYVMDAEDEVWLYNHAKFGTAVTNAAAKSTSATNAATQPNAAVKRTVEGNPKEDSQNATPQPLPAPAPPPKTAPFPLKYLETAMDLMEKATAFDAIITMDRAELLILKRLPELYHMYPRKKSKAGAVVVTLKQVLTDVYGYWVSKRSKLKRPLLRRFWPVTSSDDTNPHLVFRPREKEKYKLRRKRQNDMDGYRKLLQLKQDFEQVRAILDLVRRREHMNRTMVQLQSEWFYQSIYNAVDTSGTPRVSQVLDRTKLEHVTTVPNLFDSAGGWRKVKKMLIQSGAGGGTTSAVSSRGSSPILGLGGGRFLGGVGGDRPPMIVAGRNGGLPAPNMLQTLDTRETYETSWDHAVPPVNTYVDAHPLPTFRFRHRPRVGRGGRICIDRLPMAIDPNVPPTTFLRAGVPPPLAKKPKERLLDLLPQPLDHHHLSERIEAICLSALKEDYDSRTGGLSITGIDAEENDGDAVVVKTADWLNTDDQLWGEERYAIGPI